MALKFDKLKSLFVVSEESENTGDQNQKENTQKENLQQNSSENTKNTTTRVETGDGKSKITWKVNSSGETVADVTQNQAPTDLPGEFNPKIFEQLMMAIHKANLPGEDYIEFMEALQAMKDIPLDENIKMQTVFATLSTKGLTAQKVFESSDYYLKVLDNEKSKFYEALKSQTSNQIEKKKEDVVKLEDVIKAKIEKIAMLNEEINQAKQMIVNIKNEVVESDTKIKKTENDFLITYKKIENQIRITVEKIKTFTTK